MGTCFLHGNGSGSELNFKVVGGATQPGNPTENTIWVNTDAAITAWLFSASTPTSPVAGMVWITTAATGSVNANLLKKNAVTVCLTSAKQYIGGSWANKAAYIYQGASWVQFSSTLVYLFNYGDECTSVTGGYRAIAKALVSGTEGYVAVPTITKYSDGSRKISATNGDGGIYYTAYKIDLTKYTKLKFYGRVVDPSGYNRAGICVWSNIGSYSSSNRSAFSTGNDGSNTTRTIDVSKMNGTYYIGFCVYSSSYVTMNKMWLEM